MADLSLVEVSHDDPENSHQPSVDKRRQIRHHRLIFVDRRSSWVAPMTNPVVAFR